MAASPSIIRRNTPLSPHRFHRFHRLYSVLCGPYALGAMPPQPLRLTRTLPLNTRRSSTRGVPWLLGKYGRRRAICSSVRQYRSLILVLLAEPGSGHDTQGMAFSKRARFTTEMNACQESGSDRTRRASGLGSCGHFLRHVRLSAGSGLAQTVAWAHDNGQSWAPAGRRSGLGSP